MKPFQFRFFELQQNPNVHKFGTDTMLLGALATHTNPNSILDIGTGTGALSLMLAQKYTDAHLTAIDLNDKAIELATYNFQNVAFQNVFTTHLGSVMDCDFSNQFDMIVSNPPYFSAALKSENIERNMARHDDSLSFYDLITVAGKYLTNEGRFWVVIPYERLQQFVNTAKDIKLKLIVNYTIEGTENNPVRSILCFTKLNKQNTINKRLVIRDAQGNYTKEYKDLTLDYHKPGVFSN